MSVDSLCSSPMRAEVLAEFASFRPAELTHSSKLSHSQQSKCGWREGGMMSRSMERLEMSVLTLLDLVS